jgi:DNA sulfur modification protein DndC
METYIKTSLNLIKQAKEFNDLHLISYSGGKDSTATILLYLLAIENKIIDQDKVKVIHSNTLMEQPLVNVIVSNVKMALDIEFIYTTPPLKDRFLFNIIGRGVAVPSAKSRWCTGRLKIRPVQKIQNNLKGLPVTGERLGESKKRDLKLNNCGKSDECGIDQFGNKVFRPILNWTLCQIWDFIAQYGEYIYYNLFDDLNLAYSISESSNSLRTGCIGCPLISKDKSLEKYCEAYPNYSPLLLLHPLYQSLREKKNRVDKIIKGQPFIGGGAIKLHVRKEAWYQILEIENQIRSTVSSFILVEEEEKIAIEENLKKGVFPRG